MRAPRREPVQAVEVITPAHLYIGRAGCSRLGLVLTGWGNLFSVKASGSKEAALCQYGAWIVRQPWLRSALPGLEGKILL